MRRARAIIIWREIIIADTFDHKHARRSVKYSLRLVSCNSFRSKLFVTKVNHKGERRWIRNAVYLTLHKPEKSSQWRFMRMMYLTTIWLYESINCFLWTFRAEKFTNRPLLNFFSSDSLQRGAVYRNAFSLPFSACLRNGLLIGMLINRSFQKSRKEHPINSTRTQKKR